MESKDNNKDLTPISELGEFKLIEQLTKTFEIKSEFTDMGVCDDAAILDFKKEKVLIGFSNRSKLTYDMLIGRNLLQLGFLVDVTK